MNVEVVIPELKSLTALASYTYTTDSDLPLGSIANIPFGKKNLLGIVQQITLVKPSYELKQITSLPETKLQIPQHILQLIRKISNYYFTTPHQAANLFLPSYIRQKLHPPKKIKTSSFFDELKPQEAKELNLTEAQANVVQKIYTKTADKGLHLLLGPTGSGKTEVYKQLACKLDAEQQALILVPEISITPQLAQYFYNQFGEETLIWHSGLNKTEKKHAWWSIQQGQARIIIGSRSALFLPYPNLGLICMDEEQEDSYKQERTPRYHTRTICQWYNELLNIPVVFGSATPSLETFAASQHERITLHQLPKRISGKPPKISVVDMREEVKKRNFSIFSELLQQRLNTILEQKQQALLFLNRRGFAHSRQCFDCGQRELCPRCDSTLTYHNPTNYPAHLLCHICNYRKDVSSACPSCGSLKIKEIGLGTQQITTELSKLFPKAKILRADRDTTSKKHGFTKIYQQFSEGQADILVGTQMIAKGLHLPNVALVGVVLADVGLHIPDFRAQERAFQQLIQVAGRAGRGDTLGEVIIQTLDTANPVIQSIDHHNIGEFYTKELIVRQQHKFPPFSKLTKLTYVDRDPKLCKKIAQEVEKQLSDLKIEHFGAPALIFKQHNLYHYNILLFSNQPGKILKTLKLSPSWRIDRDPVSTAW